jgi:hypothetical protein
MPTYRAPTPDDLKDPAYLKQVFETKRDLRLLRAEHVRGARKAKELAIAAEWQERLDALEPGEGQ